jgi:hypothetical protein
VKQTVDDVTRCRHAVRGSGTAWEHDYSGGWEGDRERSQASGSQEELQLGHARLGVRSLKDTQLYDTIFQDGPVIQLCKVMEYAGYSDVISGTWRISDENIKTR